MTSFSVYYPTTNNKRMNEQSHFMATQLLIIDRYAEGVKASPKDIVEEWIIQYSQKVRDIYNEWVHDIVDIEARLYKIQEVI